jgi:hypothetical protein
MSTLNGYDTAKNILNRALVQLGLSAGLVPNMSDPFSSADPNVYQLIEYLNQIGNELNNKFDWTHLIKENTITTAASATSYDLPADFHEMIDQTGWNRSMRIPLVGPLSGQEAQFLKARLGNVLINVAFRIEGNQIIFPIAPADGQTIVFEYISTYWVASTGLLVADKSSPTAGTDYILYDPDMMVVGTKLRWMEAKGFETSIIDRQFQSMLEHNIGKNYGARTLSLGGTGLNTDRILDAGNIPPTGYG